MPDYKSMYHKMFNAVTDAERQLQNAANILQSVQQECESIYLEADDTPITLHPPITRINKSERNVNMQ